MITFSVRGRNQPSAPVGVSVFLRNANRRAYRSGGLANLQNRVIAHGRLVVDGSDERVAICHHGRGQVAETTVLRCREVSGSAIGVEVFLGQLGDEDVASEDSCEEKKK